MTNQQLREVIAGEDAMRSALASRELARRGDRDQGVLFGDGDRNPKRRT